MAINSEDINLDKFLKKFCPTSFPEQEKITLSNFEFIQIAALLKIDNSLNKLVQKLK